MKLFIVVVLDVKLKKMERKVSDFMYVLNTKLYRHHRLTLN